MAKEFEETNVISTEEVRNDVMDEETKEISALFTCTLKKPLEYNGTTYSVLDFDFEKLTGADSLNIDSELAAMGKSAVVPAFSSDYLIRMAAKACTEKIGSDIFTKMSLRDYNKIVTAARSFLIRSE